MKKNSILIIIICLLVVTIGLILLEGYSINKIENIKEFYYGYSGGMSMINDVSYTIKCNSECKANVTLARKEYYDLPISKSKMNDLLKLLNKYRIYSWNGFNKELSITDGASFHLDVTDQKGETIEARGYGRFPNNHNEFKEELNKLINSCLNDKYLYRDLDEEYNGFMGVDRRYSIRINSENNTGHDKFLINSQEELDALNKLFNNEIEIDGINFGYDLIFLQYVSGSKSVMYSTDGVYIKDNKVTIKIDESLPDDYFDSKPNCLVGVKVYGPEYKKYDTRDWVKPSTLLEG